MPISTDVTAVGLNPERWQAVLDQAARWCDADELPAIAVTVGNSQADSGVHLFGRQCLADDTPTIRDDAIFLIASITKPIVATGVLMLIERGLLSLGDRVNGIIPEFGGTGRYAITLRHLLTHTSGLPDMLPNNRKLRVDQKPLSAFVEGTCAVTPDFQPGHGVQYQSMGFALLGEIITRVTGKSCATFLQDELFQPLGLTDTVLGTPDDWYEGDEPKIDRIAELRVPPEQREIEPGDPADWGWNSRYWRSLGAPWGGLLTTPADLARLARLWLCEGTLDGKRILSPAGVRSATRNQLAPMRDVPEQDRRCRPWGLSWRLNWPAHSANFGDFLGPRTYGHWGATGTALWIDPDLDSYAIVLTTQPQEPHGTYLSRIANLIAAAFH
jgi:CubicO group peptidase (beta-lactamase class C family)